MDKIERVLVESEGICKILYRTIDGIEYEAHVSHEEFIVRLLKDKLRFVQKVPESLLEEFEQAVRDSQIESDSWNEDI